MVSRLVHFEFFLVYPEILETLTALSKTRMAIHTTRNMYLFFFFLEILSKKAAHGYFYCLKKTVSLSGT